MLSSRADTLRHLTQSMSIPQLGAKHLANIHYKMYQLEYIGSFSRRGPFLKVNQAWAFTDI